MNIFDSSYPQECTYKKATFEEPILRKTLDIGPELNVIHSIKPEHGGKVKERIHNHTTVTNRMR